MTGSINSPLLPGGARVGDTKLYAVSGGNGNDGVSHTFPDYYVRGADPFRIARLAVIDHFILGPTMRWAAEHVEVDGEADHTVSAVLYEGPEGETEFGAAYLIIEVFASAGPDMSDPWHKPVYDTPEEAFSPQAFELAGIEVLEEGDPAPLARG